MTRLRLAGALAIAAAALGGCDRGNRPDSTAGVGDRTGRPQSAGDSSRQSKQPARTP